MSQYLTGHFLTTMNPRFLKELNVNHLADKQAVNYTVNLAEVQAKITPAANTMSP